jgi:hypothetical protein
MINRHEVLIKRAVSADDGRMHNYVPADVDYKRSAVEEFDHDEYVVLRSGSDILSVFLVDDWQVTETEPEKWPDYLLEEAEAVEA